MDLVISFSVLYCFLWTKNPIQGNKCGYKGVCDAHDPSTDRNRFKPVFEWFYNIFETWQSATGIAQTLGNCNRKIDQIMVWFNSVLWFFAVLWTEPLKTTFWQHILYDKKDCMYNPIKTTWCHTFCNWHWVVHRPSTLPSPGYSIWNAWNSVSQVWWWCCLLGTTIVVVVMVHVIVLIIVDVIVIVGHCVVAVGEVVGGED